MDIISLEFVVQVMEHLRKIALLVFSEDCRVSDEKIDTHPTREIAATSVSGPPNRS